MCHCLLSHTNQRMSHLHRRQVGCNIDMKRNCKTHPSIFMTWFLLHWPPRRVKVKAGWHPRHQWHTTILLHSLPFLIRHKCMFLECGRKMQSCSEPNRQSENMQTPCRTAPDVESILQLFCDEAPVLTTGPLWCHCKNCTISILMLFGLFITKWHQTFWL